MKFDLLRFTAFCAYLAAWLVFAVGAAATGIPRMQRFVEAPARMKPAVIIGTVLQIASACVITFNLGDGPLRPKSFELATVVFLAPFAAALFVAALRSAPRRGSKDRLVTSGAYAWVRHPIYLAFFAMLLATGLLASAGPALLLSAGMYLAGCELRIASEEADLEQTFRGEYEQYRLRTRWRYLPGLR
ncbi:MAG TPA: isoprenylcysteine carboxylmethyltransferase family protein [Bryobacteraceae bacterium]|nr:isoprenylcysteine carboxylmethyltransferase family protein [Bryobacteraceae bacterium]